MRKFGVEIEFDGDLGRALAALQATDLRVIDSRHTHNTGRAPEGWALKRDGSVHRGGELVSPPLDFDDPDQRAQVTTAVEALQASGATTSTEAGIHVHVEAVNFDGTPLTGKQLAAVVRFCYKFEDAIYRVASSGWRTIRPGARTFCKPIPEATAQAIMKVRTVQELEDVWNGYDSGRDFRSRRLNFHHDRYHGVNLRSYFSRNTIEFRYFNSSVNPQRIQTYVALCIAIVDDARWGFSRSVKRSYRLGGMAGGSVEERSVLLRLQQILRSESRDTKVLMTPEDWNNFRMLLWNGSVPQRNIFSRQ